MWFFILEKLSSGFFNWNERYASCIRETVNSLSEDTKLSISLCKRNKVYYSPLERVLKLSKNGN
jgi:hypothetical protein